jgi:hypothetical protein
MSRRSSVLWGDTAKGRRERRRWTDVPGSPSRYLYARKRGLLKFAGAFMAFVVVLCVLAIFL